MSNFSVEVGQRVKVTEVDAYGFQGRDRHPLNSFVGREGVVIQRVQEGYIDENGDLIAADELAAYEAACVAAAEAGSANDYLSSAGLEPLAMYLVALFRDDRIGHDYNSEVTAGPGSRHFAVNGSFMVYEFMAHEISAV